MSQTERLYRIVRALEDAHHPVPLDHFLATLEISRATFKRDLDYLRDRLGAPIAWRRGDGDGPGGYLLEGCTSPDASTRYGIRGMWFNPSEIYALLMMQHLAAGMEPGLVSDQIDGLMTRISLMLGSAADDPRDVTRRFRILHSASRRSAPAHFDTIAQAAMKRRRLDLQYFTRGRNDTSRRVVSPQQLLHYRENWYLLGWCHKAGALRTFALDAVLDATATKTPARDIDDDVLEEAVGHVFGIFTGKVTAHAELRFSARVAAWVGKEVWHPDQRLRQEDDGTIRLFVPYADPRELLMEILRYGPDVEVIAPIALREQLASRLRAAISRYDVPTG